MASIVAVNTFGAISTTSPGLTPAPVRTSLKASKPLLTPRQYRVPQCRAASRSKSSTIEPPMKGATPQHSSEDCKQFPLQFRMRRDKVGERNSFRNSHRCGGLAGVSRDSAPSPGFQLK
jgi:hypothetical protein